MTTETVRVIDSGPLYEGGLRIVERGDVGRYDDQTWFCTDGALSICDDESAIITLKGNYENWYEIVDIDAITRDPSTGTLSFITKQNVTIVLRNPDEDDLAALAEDGYNPDGAPVEIEDGTDG